MSRNFSALEPLIINTDQNIMGYLINRWPFKYNLLFGYIPAKKLCGPGLI
jgi:hypothetical protein